MTWVEFSARAKSTGSGDVAAGGLVVLPADLLEQSPMGRQKLGGRSGKTLLAADMHTEQLTVARCAMRERDGSGHRCRAHR